MCAQVEQAGVLPVSTQVCWVAARMCAGWQHTCLLDLSTHVCSVGQSKASTAELAGLAVSCGNASYNSTCGQFEELTLVFSSALE